MPNRLEPLNLTSFVGGINLRRSNFQLGENESPDLLNVDVDPRGGFYTRKGWQRWNVDDIVDVQGGAIWEPRNAAVHNLADGRQIVYVVNEGKIYWANESGVFAELAGITVDATPHGADGATWGDYIYVACGMLRPSFSRLREDAPVLLDPDGWSEFEAPVHGTMPQAEYAVGHAGYMFCAVTYESSIVYPSRLRWSHFGLPDCWREGDFTDIEIGGGRITGLVSFRDHLLIFKTDSVWALYGYDDDSWQLVKVGRAVGCPCVTAVTRSESAVFWYSASERGGIYGYSGEEPVYISEQLRPAMEEIINYENVWVSWANRRLWVAVPWTKDLKGTTAPTTLFVFDPDIGNGAWTQYRAGLGVVGPVLDGSDVNQRFPLGAFWSDEVAIMVTLDALDFAYDVLHEPSSLSIGVAPGDGYLVTSADEEIGTEGDEYLGDIFESYYYTRWLHAGWPERKKSWRRPTFVCREVAAPVDLLVQAYRDYDETNIRRSRTLRIPAQGIAYWTETGYAESNVGGFDWTEAGDDDPRGADWGEATAGSKILRAGSLGLARAVQLRITASPTTPRQRWGVDAIVAKYILRRFR